MPLALILPRAILLSGRVQETSTLVSTEACTPWHEARSAAVAGSAAACASTRASASPLGSTWERTPTSVLSIGLSSSGQKPSSSRVWLSSAAASTEARFTATPSEARRARLLPAVPAGLPSEDASVWMDEAAPPLRFRPAARRVAPRPLWLIYKA